jgi:hypothetical protein
MTIASSPWETELDLALTQLAAIQRFLADDTLRADAAATIETREMKLDAARRREVLQRQHEALVARAHQQMLRADYVLWWEPPVRAVLAHRNEWFVDRVKASLADVVEVVATPTNGADAVGITVAEQPDLLLVEDTIEMLPCEQVVRAVREFSPQTLVAAQVAYGDRVAPLLEAGAATVFTRQVPPTDVASQLLELMTARQPGTSSPPARAS